MSWRSHAYAAAAAASLANPASRRVVLRAASFGARRGAASGIVASRFGWQAAKVLGAGGIGAALATGVGWKTAYEAKGSASERYSAGVVGAADFALAGLIPEAAKPAITKAVDWSITKPFRDIPKVVESYRTKPASAEIQRKTGLDFKRSGYIYV